ncbi:protein of unknown function [Alteromonas macleodii]|uniref:Uncharacterized protein n=1 Tax=Alteromonas macleodii TaxID=28108 RepID=A0A6T9Y821_ALTMA|nr:protein of unknown function [Alteromonas macleodii]
MIKSQDVCARISFIVLDFLNVDPCLWNVQVHYGARTYFVGLALVGATPSFTLNFSNSAF